MFGFFILRPLWKELKTPLKGILKDKFSVIGRQFKGTLSSTGNDLIVVLQNNLGAGIYNRYSSGTIKKNDEVVLNVLAFPLSSINQSKKLKDELAKAILKNDHLDASRNTLKISDTEWNDTVESYANNFLLFGLPIAIKRMIENETKLYGYGYSDYYIIDLAEGEAFRIDEKADFQKLVVIYEKETQNKKALKVSKARSIWKDRANSKYKYKLDNYKSYKMP